MQQRRKRTVCAAVVAGTLALAGCIFGCAPHHEAMTLPAQPVASESMAMPEAFAMDITCTGCHAKATEAMGQTGFTGAYHATQECTSCHSDEAGLTTAHSNRFDAKSAASLVALTKTKIDPEMCYSCHGSMEELAAKTADCTVLTDENGKTVNPHDLPEGHFGVNVDCGSCHKMHSAVDTATSAQNSCMTCHHNNVYECGTCHDV